MENESRESIKSTDFLKIIKLLNCGFTTGLIQAAVFNPWDRALYLSVINKRRFLHFENFHQPMKGVLQTIFQRAISTGLYFPLEEIFANNIKNSFTDTSNDYFQLKMYSTFLGGMIAGAFNGLILNPFSSIKVSSYIIQHD